MPGRHLPRRRRHLVPGAHVDVHRAGGRLQPRSGRPRQRRHERDHAGPLAARGAQALRERDRVRRAAGVRGPQAQELLLRHARAAGVLGGDPGRRRHPADRRGPRRRRRGFSAEVLRRVQRACATGARRSCSSPTTWARCSASATGRCCSSAASPVYLGEPQRGRRPLPGDQLRPRSGGRRAAAPSAGPATARRGCVEAWVEDERASGVAARPAGTAGHAAGAGRVHGRRRGPGSERVRAQRGAQGDRGRHHRDRARAQRPLRAPARRSCSRSPSTTCSRPAATAR